MAVKFHFDCDVEGREREGGFKRKGVSPSELLHANPCLFKYVLYSFSVTEIPHDNKCQ